MAGIVQTPWTYGTCNDYRIYDNQYAAHENPDGSSTDCSYDAGFPATITIIRPSQSGVTAPAAYATFLASLPVAPSSAAAA